MNIGEIVVMSSQTIRIGMQEQVSYQFYGYNYCNYIDIARCLYNRLRNRVKSLISYARLF